MVVEGFQEEVDPELSLKDRGSCQGERGESERSPPDGVSEGLQPGNTTRCREQDICIVGA